MEAKTLGLYLGCDINNGEWQLIGITSTHEGLQCPLIKDKHRDYVCSVPFTDVKLRLRPLTDMTESEAREYLLIRYNALTKITVKSDKNGFWYSYGDKLSEIVIKRKFIFHGQIRDNNYPQQFQYLLSKSFDIFELIEKGEALDATKLNP